MMERYRTIRAYSAGGVVFRHASPACAEQIQAADRAAERARAGMGIEVALVGWYQPAIWALPKGTPQEGETIEQVALREVQEETGLQVRLIGYVGNISYSFKREQVRYYKQVRHFLFEAIGGDVTLHDHEYDLAEWFSLAEAGRRLTYQNEITILYQAETILQRWLQHQQKEGQL